MNNQRLLNQAVGSAIKRNDIRFDLQIIANLIKEKSKVLDVGCGDGELLEYLKINKKIEGRGLEIKQLDVSRALSKGISVMQGDAQNDLSCYPDNSFDYAILSQTLQATKNPDEVIEQMLRIAKFVIISFPNFAHYKNRLYLGLKGKMPVSKTIPHQWYDTPNIHFCSIKDFTELCSKMNIVIKKSVYFTNQSRLNCFIGNKIFANLLAEYGLFVITKNEILMTTEPQLIFNKVNKFLNHGDQNPSLANQSE